MSKQTISEQKAGPVEGPLADNERLKRESNFLRGTIEQDLQDPLTGGFNGDNFQLIRFHGMYQQDDRDLRKERRRNQQEPARIADMRIGPRDHDLARLDRLAQGLQHLTWKLRHYGANSPNKVTIYSRHFSARA